METPPDPGDTKDFRFEKLSEFVAWTPDQEATFKDVVRGVTVANRFGLVFCVREKGFYVLDCTSPALTVKSSGGEKLRLEETRAFTVGLQYQPVLLSVSSSGLTLAVCVVRDQLPVAFLYDVRAFSRKVPQTQPFHTVQLSSQPGVTVSDFSWIPTNEESFAVVLSTGSVGLFELKELATTIVGTLPENTGATCISWSPKGKQFVIGRSDGSLAQFKPDLTLARSIPGPKNLTVQTRNILWLSTFVFAVTYKKPTESHPILVIVNAPKTGDPIFTNFDDVCGGFTDQRVPFYHLWPIFEWNVVLAASNNALEIGVLSCQSQDQTTGWLQLMLEETARAEAPLVGSDESFVLGLGLVTCTSVPVLLLATTLGVVATFRIVNTMRINGTVAPNFCSLPEQVSSIPGERPQLAAPQAPASTSKFKVPSEVIENKPSGSLFGLTGSSSAGLFCSSPAASFGFGSSVAAASTGTSGSLGSANMGAFFGGGGLVTSTTSDQPGKTAVFQPSQTAASSSGFSFGAGPTTSAEVNVTKSLPSTQPAGKSGDGARLQKEPEDASSSVSTTIVSRKAPQPVAPPKPPSTAPAQVPSRQLQQFMQKVTALSKRLHTLSIESAEEENQETQQRMDALTHAFDDLTEYFDDAALKINEQERTLEERLHVVEEAMLIIERCSDSQFLELLKNLPLEPLQRRKFEVLEKHVTEMENKLRSIRGGLDMELDMLEARKGERSEDQTSIAKRIIDDLETLALQLQKKLHELEKKARRFGPVDKSQKFQAEAFSPAEAIGRLYPDLSQFTTPFKPSSAFVSKLRANVKSAPMRVTRHEVVLFQRGQSQKPQPEKGRTFALPPAPASFLDISGTTLPKQQDTTFTLPFTAVKSMPANSFAGFGARESSSDFASKAASFGSTNPEAPSAFCKPGSSASLFASLGLLPEKSPKESGFPFGSDQRGSLFAPKANTSTSSLGIQKPKPASEVPGTSTDGALDFSGFKFDKTSSAKPEKPQTTPQKPDAPSAVKPATDVFGFGGFKLGSSSTEKSAESSGSTQEEPESTSVPKPALDSFAFGGFSAPVASKPAEEKKPGKDSSSVVGSMIKSALLKSTADNASSPPKNLTGDQGASSPKAQPGSSFGTADAQPVKAVAAEDVKPEPSQLESKPMFVGFHAAKPDLKDVTRAASPEVVVKPAGNSPTSQPSIPVPAMFAAAPSVGLTITPVSAQQPAPPAPSASSLFAPSPVVAAPAPFSFAVKEVPPANPFDKPLFGSGALSAFGSTPSPFGASPSNKPFGEQPGVPDSSATKSTFGGTGFGASPFGQSTPVKAPEPEKSAFGGNAFGGLSLGSTTTPTKEPNKNPFALPGFGNATPSTTASAGLFSSNSFSAFSSPSTEPKPVQASVSSTFPSSAFEPAKPIWGTPAPPQPTASGFSGFKLDTPSSAFGSSPFSSAPNPFAAQAAAAGFPSSSGFGSGFGTSAPAASGFGAPAFGGAPAPGGFGSAPATGGFGSAPAFGSSQPGSGGGAIWNQPGGFAAYASQPSVSFGAVAAQGGQSNAFGAQPSQQAYAPPQNNAFTQYR